MLLSPMKLFLDWVRVEAQRAQTVVITNLHELKNFDAITHKENRLRDKNASNTIITRKRCQYCGLEQEPG